LQAIINFAGKISSQKSWSGNGTFRLILWMQEPSNGKSGPYQRDKKKKKKKEEEERS
jgi:hypothetical protein